MNIADVVIVGAVLVAMAAGRRLGLVARLMSWTWMLVAVVAVIRLLPLVLARVPQVSGISATFVTMVAIGLGLGLGNAVGLALAARVGPSRRRGAVATTDRVLGSVAGAAGVLVIVWLLLPVAAGSPGPLAAAVSQSSVAQFIDQRFPEPPDAAQTLRRFTSDVPFPQVFDVLQATPDPGPPPPASGLSGETADQVASSVVLVRVPACGGLQNGTGFVVAGGRPGDSLLVTNAHVVAGGSAVEVVRNDGVTFTASVVAFDPVGDLAVLRTEFVDRPALVFGGPPGPAMTGAVFGHPGGGALRIAAARVSRELDATGRDIYGAPGAQRSVLELAAELRPGDSGAPLVDAQGGVHGVVFAVASDRNNVAYALAAASAASLVNQVTESDQIPVDAGRCLN